MVVYQVHYEELLAEYSNYDGAIALLKQYRPYLETIPSMRRPDESVITIPLPNIRVRQTISKPHSDLKVAAGEVIPLPCDVVILMCDPEWKIKTGVEIPIYIHRPQEDFSALLTRWRHTQVLLSQEYEWLMPMRHKHLLSEGADKVLPLFVVFPETPDRILRGLRGAGLPFVVSQSPAIQENFAGADDESASSRESQDQPQD
ncbi:MAG: hypothetical protein ACTS2F_15055 [Thainema sp.]